MIILITKDKKVERTVATFLGSNRRIDTCSQVTKVFSQIAFGRPQLILLDAEINKKDFLTYYKKIRQINPELPVIILAKIIEIKTVVAATKLGVFDFLEKPLVKGQFLTAVENATKKKETVSAIEGLEELRWLNGGSVLLKSIIEEIGAISLKLKDVVLVGEEGVDKEAVARVIHRNSRHSGTFKKIKIAPFSADADEAYFWINLQEQLIIKEKAEKETKISTLYIEGISSLEPLFRSSFFDFIDKRKRNPKFDREIRTIISLRRSSEELPGFHMLALPPLRSRRADLSQIVEEYILHFSKEFKKPVKGIGLDLIPFFTYYPFPGNYCELEALVRNGVMLSKNELLSLSDLPLTESMLIAAAVEEAISKNQFELKRTRKSFEKTVYQLVLGNYAGNTRQAARFLDLQP
ncbi:response regulator [Candidatus Margulisiibacteriota bacterium]